MPTSEMEESVEGAEEFALEYFDLLAQTLLEPEEGLLLEHASEECSGCENFEGNVAYMVANKLSVATNPISAKGVVTQTSGDTYVVQINFDQEPYALVDRAGVAVEEYPGAADMTMQLNLTWDSGAWRIDSLATGEV